jgi:hypothetical protein
MTRTWLLLALVAWWSVPARAQEPTALADAVRIVRTESPLVRVLEAEIDAAEGAVEVAGVYPNPFLGYAGFGRFDGGNGAINGTQHQLWLDFPLLLAGQNVARRDVAEAEVDALRARREVLGLALEVEARRTYLALHVAQEREARLSRARAELGSLEALVTGRVAAGAQSDYDAARIAIEGAALDAQLASALVERIGSPGRSARSPTVRSSCQTSTRSRQFAPPSWRSPRVSATFGEPSSSASRRYTSRWARTSRRTATRRRPTWGSAPLSRCSIRVKRR